MKRIPNMKQLEQMKAALATLEEYVCKGKCNECSINERMDDEDTCPVTTLKAIVEGIETDIVKAFYQGQEEKNNG